MIFSNKIFKIDNGINITLYANNADELLIFLYNKSLNLYQFNTKSKEYCAFLKKYNYKKMIKLNQEYICICHGEDIQIIKNEENI